MSTDDWQRMYLRATPEVLHALEAATYPTDEETGEILRPANVVRWKDSAMWAMKEVEIQTDDGPQMVLEYDHINTPEVVVFVPIRGAEGEAAKAAARANPSIQVWVVGEDIDSCEDMRTECPEQCAHPRVLHRN